jgi:Flp pilus assembly protein TadD
VAIFHLKVGQFGRAIDDYDEGIRLAPTYGPLFVGRGAAYLRTGQLQKALLDLDVAARLTPDDPKIFNNRGTAYFSMGQTDLAIRDYTEAIRSGFPSPGRQLLISSQCTNCATHRPSRRLAIRTMQGNALRKSKH